MQKKIYSSAYIPRDFYNGKAQKFRHWSISSLHLWARRNNLIHASLNTWYKYNQLFAWRDVKERLKKYSYSPLRASHPNEYWHADVSIHQCLNGIKGYIYTVMDNASRKVLAWNVADHLSGKLMMQVLEDAKSLIKKDQPIKLVVDGGTENFNSAVDDFLSDSNLSRLRAKVDIKQSNSMVEAMFSQLKHRLLLTKDIHNLSQLHKNVSFFFNDANQNKPLKVLDGLTPNEYYEGNISSNHLLNHEKAKKAIEKRKVHNTKNLCLNCLE